MDWSSRVIHTSCISRTSLATACVSPHHSILFILHIIAVSSKERRDSTYPCPYFYTISPAGGSSSANRSPRAGKSRCPTEAPQCPPCTPFLFPASSSACPASASSLVGCATVLTHRSRGKCLSRSSSKKIFRWRATITLGKTVSPDYCKPFKQSDMAIVISVITILSTTCCQPNKKP